VAVSDGMDVESTPMSLGKMANANKASHVHQKAATSIIDVAFLCTKNF